MGKQETNDVAQLIRLAADAAKHAPEHLQEAAFNKAFEAFSTGTPSRGSKRSSDGSKKGAGNGGIADADEAALNQLDRTAHPEIKHSNTALINSLYLLRAVSDDLNIDGLSAASIARVLTEQFRCDVTRQAVGLALNSAGRFVNRQQKGNQVLFRIMSPGTEYLDSLVDTGHDVPASRTKRKGRKKRSSKKKSTRSKVALKKKKIAANSTSTKKKPSRRGTGPAAAMEQLLNAGFFSSHRTIAAIINKLKHDHGRTFKPNELSPVLLRWIRNETLKRQQNKDNQYEYKQP